MPALIGQQDAGVLFRYKDRLPVTDATPMITLGEGSTPLVRSTRLEEVIGCEALYFKLESCNPSGSFKPDNPLIIEPDGRVRWQHVVNAFNAAVKARYTNVAFAQARLDEE